ncbi:hypothetical protein EDB86DRAFT_2883105 [Lactarius hatsudake]|nr:hypothetical protein EDB86DRAFT_2883105 [Lactarius hatsudake]
MALSYLHDIPHERARVRTVILTGMELFWMKQTVGRRPSQCCFIRLYSFFFTGLVDFFLLFNKTVTWVFIGWLGLFASLYTALTVSQTPSLAALTALSSPVFYGDCRRC